MKKYVHILIALLMLMAGGCTKNEFKIEGRLGDKSTLHSVVVSYHASDSKKGWVVSFEAPVAAGVLDITGYTHDPTVVWISSSGGTELTWFYAERGDKISITAEADKPDTWRVTGNKTDELLSSWREENDSLLKGANVAAINDAVVRFVEENANTKAAALLLLNTFDRGADVLLFDKLWSSLGKKADKEAMLKASGIDPSDVVVSRAKRIEKLTLYASADTLETFRMADARATVLAFTHGDEPRRTTVTSLLTSLSSLPNTRTIEVGLESDMSLWRYTLPTSPETSPVNFAWVQGGAAAPALKGIHIGPTPWYVAFDYRGRTAYCGNDSVKLRSALKKLK